MDISVSVDADVLAKFLRAYPQKMDAHTRLFVDRVGFKLANASIKAAPAVTGNLRRTIFYFDETIASYMNNQAAGELVANANYAKYVHGQPFYKNRMKRRETPFITDAISSSDTFIKNEAVAMINRVLT